MELRFRRGHCRKNVYCACFPMNYINDQQSIGPTVGLFAYLQVYILCLPVGLLCLPVGLFAYL